MPEHFTAKSTPTKEFTHTDNTPMVSDRNHKKEKKTGRKLTTAPKRRNALNRGDVYDGCKALNEVKK